MVVVKTTLQTTALRCRRTVQNLKTLLPLTLRVANSFRVTVTNSSSLKKTLCRYSYSLSKIYLAYHVIKNKIAGPSDCNQSFFVLYCIVLYFYSASIITNTTVKNKIKCDATELVRSPRMAFT